MKAKFLSDIHFEYATEEKKAQIEAYGKDADLLLLAGDYGDSLEVIQECLSFISKSCKQFVFVLGNHDLTVEWDKDIDTTEEKIRRIKNFSKSLGNATLLGCDNEHLTRVGGVLIGGTMGIWDHYVEDIHEESEWENTWYDGKYWGKDVKLADICRDEINKLRIITAATPHIVLTHFAPWECNTNPKYKDSSKNKFFYFNLDQYNYSGIRYWGCGHTHDAHKKMIGNTQVMLNPLGYGSEREQPFALNNLSANDFTVEI